MSKQNRILHAFFLFLAFSLFSTSALAKYHICLNARSNPNKFKGGHAFVTFLANGKVKKTFGYFPVKPTAWAERGEVRTYNQWWGHDRLVKKYGKNYRQTRFCMPITKRQYNTPETYSRWYVDRHPNYDKMNINCVRFAVKTYEYITGDRVGISSNPGNLIRKIDRARQQQARTLREVRRPNNN